MIIGVGIDVCDVDRFAQSIERRPGLIRRIFTPAEAERPMASKAARFAAKEALAKALGAPDGLSWLDAEVVTDDHGKPSFKIMGTVAARAADLQEEMAEQRFSVPPDTTETAATQRTSQRAERAIENSAMREQPKKGPSGPG